MLVIHPNFRLLAGLQALAGVAILPYLVTDPHPGNWMAGVCAIMWLLLAGINWTGGQRLPPAAFEASLYVSAVVLAVHAAVTPRAPMQVLDGMELLVLGMLAAFALTPIRVRVWLAVAGALYIVALAVNSLLIGAWLGPVIVLMAAATTIVVSRLVHQVREVTRRDALTGALNRVGLADQCEVLRAISERNGSVMSVVFVDLDGFKGYNDSNGHVAGDGLLSDVVAALRRNLRASDLVARVGGDEFVVVMSGVDALQAEAVMTRIAQRLPIAVTYGAVDWPFGTPLPDVIDRADQIMYERKRRPRQNTAHPVDPA